MDDLRKKAKEGFNDKVMDFLPNGQNSFKRAKYLGQRLVNQSLKIITLRRTIKLRERERGVGD